jgi:hypothetical protein
MNGLVKLYELKKGDKFYSFDDNLIYVLHDCTVDMNDPDNIKWRGRRYKSADINETHQIHGMGVRDMEYYKYTGRDRSSFMAGFREAIMLCNKHMGSIDKENAGIDNPVAVHMTMLTRYREWCKNLLP